MCFNKQQLDDGVAWVEDASFGTLLCAGTINLCISSWLCAVSVGKATLSWSKRLHGVGVLGTCLERSALEA